MKKVLKYLLILIVVGAFGWTLVYLYQKSQKKEVVYDTKTPYKSNVILKTVATGSVVPRKEIEIKPVVSGLIEELYVEPGQIVRKGDLIAKVKIIPDMVTLNNAESRLNKAKINLQNANREYKRRKDLYEKEVIPETEFLEYEMAYETAQEEMEAAENHLELIREGVIKKAGKATNTLVRSTIEGMVLDVPVEVGNSVIETNAFNAGSTIAFVANMGEMIFEGKVDETEVGKIKEGMPLILTIGAIEDETFDAMLEYIAPKGVEENGAIQFEIKASVALKENFFVRAGYSANADIVLDRRDSVLVVQESLVQFEDDTAYVEVETEPQVFEKREIKLGLSDGIIVEVLGGISKDDKLKVADLSKVD